MLKVHKVGDLADSGSIGEAEVTREKLGPWPEKKKNRAQS
jgi:pyruvate kinase